MIKKLKVVIIVLFFLLPLVPLMNCSGGAESAKKPDNAPQEIKNLEAFTRLYGYVRFFYPGDEAAAVDWDRFAVYGAQRVAAAKTADQLKKILEELFLPIAPALVIHDGGEKREFSMKSITPPDLTGMKPVSWQHSGVQLSQKPGLYRSSRLNRNAATGSSKFGNIMQFLDARPYRGKEIRFRAALKVKKGSGRLWLRVDRENRKPGFFDNMDDRPVTVSDWTYAEISGPVAQDAQRVFLGSMLYESGELLLDDTSLAFRDKGAKDWTPIALSNPGFETDRTGEPPAKWSMGDQSYSFAVTEESAAQGSRSVRVKMEFAGLFQKEAKIGDHVANELGSGLSFVMPIVLYGTGNATFPASPQTERNDLTNALKTEVPEKLTADNMSVRLGSVVITWNVFQHFFPYFDVVKADWPAELRKALTSALSDNTPKEFKKTLERMTAALKDGHVAVRNVDSPKDRKYPPINWRVIGEKLVVTDVYDKTVDSVLPGDVVVEFEGVAIDGVLAERRTLISAASEGWMKYRVAGALLFESRGEPLKFKVERDGKVTDVVLNCTLNRDEMMKARAEAKRKSGKVEEGIYYLDLAQIPMPEITKMMPQLQKANAIICDMRGYPKGNHKIISHFLKEDAKDNEWMWIPQIVYPDYRDVAYRKVGWNMTKSEPHLDAKILFITEGLAISYAESFMGFIEGYNLATIAGQPTAGTNGNVNPFNVPGGYRISWTGMKVVKHDGSQHHGVGIIPHVPMEYTVKGIKEGRDEFFEKALEIAKENRDLRD